jgi:hypothetical protein
MREPPWTPIDGGGHGFPWDIAAAGRASPARNAEFDRKSLRLMTIILTNLDATRPAAPLQMVTMLGAEHYVQV